jgi:hypothetical protein
MWMRGTIDQAAIMQLSSIVEFMDLDPTTLIEVLQHDQLGNIAN